MIRLVRIRPRAKHRHLQKKMFQLLSQRRHEYLEAHPSVLTKAKSPQELPCLGSLVSKALDARWIHVEIEAAFIVCESNLDNALPETR